MGAGLRMTGGVLLTIALLVACTAGPLVLARQVHPAAGGLAAVAAAVLWTRLVPPGPGFIQGIVSANGLAVILAVLLVCLALLTRQVLHHLTL